jgi:putative transcriptional regulator
MTDILHSNDLSGRYLLGTSAMRDKRFRGAVIYLVTHGKGGATGFILNQVLKDVEFIDILKELELIQPFSLSRPLKVPVLNGGPLEEQRGFLLHSGEGMEHGTSAEVREGLYLSSTLEMLKAIADNEGPVDYKFFLGFCGWNAGQLEKELTGDGWLVVDAPDVDIFTTNADDFYGVLMEKAGILGGFISGAGNA